MTDLEKMTASVLDRHPEYQAFFLSPDYIDQDWPVEYGETNPFLHISMHLAIAEQLSIDQPSAYARSINSWYTLRATSMTRCTG